ncbi:hypothetical protein IYC_02169 [Clostridium sporogenes PA 3679]|nr:hypothetical protein IYC_02169 [Clostridium sporogenes PA 3679]
MIFPCFLFFKICTIDFRIIYVYIYEGTFRRDGEDDK